MEHAIRIRRRCEAALRRAGLPALLLLSGCAAGGPPASGVAVATPEQVAHCRSLGIVTGTNSAMALTMIAGLEDAKAAALREAARRGATHLVWLNLLSNEESAAYAKGNAYACPAAGGRPAP